MSAVVFDLDGTLLNTLGDLNQALNHTLKTFGEEEVSIDKTCMFVGHGIKNLIKDASKNKEIDDMFKEFMNFYNNHYADFTKPYDGILDLVKYLKDNNIKLGVISNKHILVLEKLINKFFPSEFDYIIGDGMGYKRKPDIEAIEVMKEKLGDNDIIYIGDSEVDYETIKNANIKGLIVSYGFRDKNELLKYGVNKTYDNVLELKSELKVLLGL